MEILKTRDIVDEECGWFDGEKHWVLDLINEIKNFEEKVVIDEWIDCYYNKYNTPVHVSDVWVVPYDEVWWSRADLGDIKKDDDEDAKKHFFLFHPIQASLCRGNLRG